jgi:hypothetical protein
MLIRLLDLFLGLSLGNHIPTTIPVMGLSVPWDLTGLGICLCLLWGKKLAKFVWKLFIKAIINAIKKELDKDVSV